MVKWWFVATVPSTETPAEASERLTKAERDKAVPERRTKELDGYVGFANLPNQVFRKAVKKGFDFTLMVVGEYKWIMCCVYINLE